MTRSLFAKSGSRLRAEPSKDASVVAKLPANAEIRAIGTLGGRRVVRSRDQARPRPLISMPTRSPTSARPSRRKRPPGPARYGPSRRSPAAPAPARVRRHRDPGGRSGAELAAGQFRAGQHRRRKPSAPAARLQIGIATTRHFTQTDRGGDPDRRPFRFSLQGVCPWRSSRSASRCG